MRGIARLAGAAGAAAFLCGQAVGEDAEFTRKGTSRAVQSLDSARCWRAAQKARLTEEQATQDLMSAYLVGGIVGVLIVSSANEEANKDPKSAFRRRVHDDCMVTRGYRKVD
jgi:hypothetical protein